MSTPLVAVIILSWNNAADTLACLASVQALDYPHVSTIVVDNGSTDDSVARIRAGFPAVTVIENGANLGYAEGNNVGMRAALAQGADYIFILNNDVVLAPDAVSRLVEAMEADACIGMAGPAVFFADPPDRLFSTGSRIDWRRGQTRHIGMGSRGVPKDMPCIMEVDFLVGCAVCVRREVIEKIGAFDPAYYLNFEDVEWGVRARRHGYRVVCVPQARVWHKLSSSLGFASPQNTYYMTRNALRFFWRHAPGMWKIAAVAQIIWRTVWIIGAWTLKRRYRNDLFRRKRDANVLALRDFFLRRFGQMGADVAKVCNMVV